MTDWKCPECGKKVQLPEGVTPGWHYKAGKPEYSYNTCTAPMEKK